jgi:hypothetical protein
MARDGSGNYSIPNTFTPSTTIASAAVNANFSDIATAMTNSLARNSEGPMTAALVLHQNGFNYEIDPDTGIKRTGANEQAVFCGGANVMVIGTATISIAIAVSIAGAFAANGAVAFGSTASFGGTITVTSSAANFIGAELISTDAGAGDGPKMLLYRNSASPAASDTLGNLEWQGQDSGGNKTRYAYQTVIITDPTNGSEDADWFLQTIVAGVETTILRSIGTQINIPAALVVTGNVTAAGLAATGAVSGATAAGAMLASQADQETSTATNKLVTPGVQQFHPSSSKSWHEVDSAGNVGASYNMTSVTANSSSDFTANIGTDHSGAAYGIQLTARNEAASNAKANVDVHGTVAPTAGTYRYLCVNANNDGGLTPLRTYGLTHGDQ